MLTSAPTQDAAAPGDNALVERVLDGDTDAFTVLMRRHNRLLFRTARSILKDDAEAEDVLQDAYLLAFRGLARFRGEASLSTWLTRIVLNVALGRQRKNSRRAEIIQFDSAGPLEPAEYGLPSGGACEEEPEMAAIRAETRQLLEKKIDELPEAFRTVFVLREIEDLSVEQVGAALGIREATVRTRHFRGRALLRASLSRELDFAMQEAFSFDGERCDRIVDGVVERLSAP
jgi:RNA polymerase sigma-70 factor (ECF subfamily)